MHGWWYSHRMGASVNQDNGTTQSGVLSQGLGIARDQSNRMTISSNDKGREGGAMG